MKEQEYLAGHFRDLSQRVMVRFGNPEELGYDQEFSIACLKITPLADRFGETLSHRDYLGALMSLGIERELLGDILIREKTAWLFCAGHIAPFLKELLSRIRHTDIFVSIVKEIPEDLQPELK